MAPSMGSLQHGFLLISRPSRVLVSLKDLPDYVGLTHENLSPFQLTECQLIRKLNYIYKIPCAIKCNIIMGVILHCIRKSCLLGAGLLEAILEFCLPQLCVTKTRFFTCLYKLSFALLSRFQILNIHFNFIFIIFGSSRTGRTLKTSKE